MTSAFIFSDDTILCHQTSDGWWPLPVQYSKSDVDLNNDAYPQAYQIGHVALLESLALIHWQTTASTDHSDVDIRPTFTAQASSAMSYDYAVAHHVALPPVNESSGNTFVPYRQLILQLPVALSNQLSQAIQLLRWQTDTRFCSRCATPVIHARNAERAMVCPACQLHQYPRVQPCIITAITRPNPQTGETQILLAHHHRHGQQKQPPLYGLIAGFVEVGESLEHAVVREVAEEVNITLTDIRYISSQPWPFPTNLMLGFRATYAGGDIIIQEDELAHADFFDLSNLPKIPSKGSIAYELIAQILTEQGFEA